MMPNRGFAKLNEECGELIAAAADYQLLTSCGAPATGLDRQYQTDLVNEMGDVIAAIHFIVHRNELDDSRISARIAIQETFDRGPKPLLILISSCGSLVQIASKKIAFPDAFLHPDGLPIDSRLEDKMADTLAAIFAAVKVLGLDKTLIEARLQAKLTRFQKWEAGAA